MKEGRHFGVRLREARLGAGYSQSDLEEISGIPKARLSRYENGHVEPSIQTLNRLARALQVSEASLLGDERAAMEEFFATLAKQGIQVSTKSQATALAASLVKTVQAQGGIEAFASTTDPSLVAS
jgi:transcriptional regulator with XRE-family HTH domain